MAQVEPPNPSEGTIPSRPKLLYGLNDQPPFKDALFVALQHVCAIFIPVMTPGLLIMSALGLDPNRSAYILGMSLFVSGIGTFLQAYQLGPIGSGLLAVQGTSFAFVTPILAVVTTSLQAGKTPEQTLSLILGLCFFGSWIPIVLSRFLHLTRKIFTPLVTGTAVTLIGLCLIKVGVFYMAGGSKAQAIAKTNPDSPLAFGSLQNWALSIAVLAIVGLCSLSPNRYLRMGSVIIGMVIGLIASLFLGITDFSGMATLPLINIPMPFRFGLAFDFTTFIGFAVVYVVLTLEVLGDITATSLVSGEPIEGSQYIRKVKGGILADGVNSLLASVLGSFPIVTPAQNNGIIQLTGVGSRYIGYFIAAILVTLGLFPRVGGVLLAIPTSVFGGAVTLMFATVAIAGFKILREVKMTPRSFSILAISLATGLGVTFVPEAVRQFPDAIQSVLESEIATGSLCALILNLVVPKSEETSDSILVAETEATPEP